MRGCRRVVGLAYDVLAQGVDVRHVQAVWPLGVDVVVEEAVGVAKMLIIAWVTVRAWLDRKSVV